MATLDSPVAVQLPSRDHVTEAVSHVASYNISSTGAQDDAPHRQVISTPTHVSNTSAPSSLRSQHKTAHRRWKPRYHLMPPTGWLNDPCAPGYDAVHEVYHVGFQWNPKEPEWGNISWGSALSKDLLVWDIGNLPSIEPSAKPDGEAGVFTGCWSPATTVPGRSTAFYTSARMLPIHHTLPYNWGSEAICVATTADAGRTWQRGHTSIVLQGPPQHLQVTGWRDPFVAQWPSLSRLIGEHSDKTSFGIVSGGIRHVGPAIFLYSLSQNDVTDWNFVSVLSMAPTLRNAPTSHWEPDYGANWEVVNFLSLPDPDDAALSHDVLVIGVEGREQVPTKTSGRYRHSEFRRDHSQMWVSGTLVKTSAGIQMKFRSGAALDYGAMYAVNSFHDPKTNQQIAFGWIVEEDLPIELRKIQGWAGLLSVPRAVQLKRIRHVVKALKSELASIKSFDVVLEEDNPQQMGFAHAGCPETYTLTTLCALPDPRLKGLRHTQRSLRSATHRSSPGALGSLDFPLGCSCWEVDVLFDIGADIESIGFVISHTKESELRTLVSFNPEAEMLRIIRAKSTNIGGVCLADEEAPHTLFSTLVPGTEASLEPVTTQEALRLHAFFDVSCLELFANDRTAITTRVYPDSMTCFSILPFVTTKGGRPWSGSILEFNAWELGIPPS